MAELLEQYEGMRQVELVDIVVELPSVHPTVVLRERDAPWRQLWFPVGQPEGVALAMAWQGVATPRPLTHELFREAMVLFGIRLEVVRITGLSGRTYLAELVLSRDGELQSVECRPSDALTLALRQSLPVPVMVAEELLQPVPPSETAAGEPEPGAEPEAGEEPDAGAEVEAREATEAGPEGEAGAGAEEPAPAAPSASEPAAAPTGPSQTGPDLVSGPPELAESLPGDDL